MGKKIPQTTTDRVKAIISEILGATPEQVTDNAKLIEDLGADSLDGVALAMELEREFSLSTITDDKFGLGVRVKDVAAYVDERIYEEHLR